jgi:hypothetical protein
VEEGSRPTALECTVYLTRSYSTLWPRSMSRPLPLSTALALLVSIKFFFLSLTSVYLLIVGVEGYCYT